MAAITSSNVTRYRSYTVVDQAGAVQEKVSDLGIVLSAQGGTAGDIPAAALGFARINRAFATALDLGAGTVVGALVGTQTDGSELFPVDITQATDANRANRANLTGTLHVRVYGIPN